MTGAAARIVQCDPATVRRAVIRGELPAYRLGPRGAYRIRVDELPRWARPAHEDN